MQLIDICANIAHTLLPQNCILCGGLSLHEQLCPGCMQDMPWLRGHSCPVCALPTNAGEVCGRCLGQTPHFDATFSPLAFDFPVNKLIHALKYHRQLSIADLLANAIVRKIAGNEKPDFILPMPLHASRLKQRGFNQAHEIARRIAHILDLPLESEVALRVRPTESQAGLSLELRKRNVRGAFVTTRELRGATIAIIDDVMTTGATLNELAQTLKRADAGRVECWVASRTLKE